jgi:hypothetical protein
MFGQVVMQVNGKTINQYIQVCLLTVAHHYSNAKLLLVKYIHQLAVVMYQPHRLLPVHIQPSQNSVHALLTFQAVKHGKVKLIVPTVNTVSHYLVVGSRFLTPVRQTHHHAEQA